MRITVHAGIYCCSFSETKRKDRYEDMLLFTEHSDTCCQSAKESDLGHGVVTKKVEFSCGERQYGVYWNV